MVRLDVLTSAVANAGGLDPDNVAADKTRILSFINDTRREIYTLPYDFPFLNFHGEIVGTLDITAGTVTVKPDQAEVTGASTSWTTAMSGRYFQAGSEFQRITYATDSTHLSLEIPWQGVSAASQSYSIQKREYTLPAMVSKVLSLKDHDTDKFLDYFDYYEFQHRFKDEKTSSNPDAYSVFSGSEVGLSFLDSTVFTGVTSTANSPILTFSGTELYTAMAPGTRVVFGDSTTSTAFYIERVLNDTKASLNSRVDVTLGGFSATAQNIGSMTLHLWPKPDTARVFTYTAKKRLFDLFSEDDLIEDEWYTAIKLGAVAKTLEYVNSPRYLSKLGEFNGAIANLIRSYKRHDPYPRLKPLIKERYKAVRWLSDKV